MLVDSDFIATLCYSFFNKLPKKGKPKPESQWTTLSCVIMSTPYSVDNKLEIVSLGTGTRCIGSNKMSGSGDILNDCHAEVMARRGFLRFLYEQVHNVYNETESIFTKQEDGTVNLKENIKFIFFCTQSPCGDISNVLCDDTNLKPHNFDKIAFTIDSTKNKRHKEMCHEVNKRGKLDDGTFTNITGAKTLVMIACDEKDVGLGLPCTKPGKGTPTLSMSCSDKLAKWLRVGVQGALLSVIIKEPIFFESIVIADKDNFSKTSFYRGLVDRSFSEKYASQWDDLKLNSSSILPFVPDVRQSCIQFEFNNSKDRTPCDSSIVWCKVKEKPLEVAVNGKVLGVTKKNMNSLSASLAISKYNLFKTFMSLPREHKILREIPEDASYRYVKELSVNYYNKWNNVKTDFFGMWVHKPDLLNFKIEKTLHK